MPWVVSGNCSQCGKCCYKKPIGELWDADMLDKDGKRCKFYEDSVSISDKFGHCKIMKAAEPKKVLSSYGEQITDEELVWYYENCPDYPNSGRFKDEWGESKFTPPNDCAYSIVWVD
jgi:hypothetical protein